MPSPSSDHVITRHGIILPAWVAATISDHDKHPEKGRLLDRTNPYPRRIQGRAVETNPNHPVHKNKSPTPHARLSCTTRDDGDELLIKGSVSYHDNTGVTNISCSGYFISTFPGEDDLSVITLQIPEFGMVPCLCPTLLIDAVAVDAVKSSHDKIADKRKSRYERKMRWEKCKSIPAYMGDIQGHLIIEGSKGIKGRVVDKCMLASIGAGSIRHGEHSKSKSAYYTLKRNYQVQGERMFEGTVHVLYDSPNGMNMCRGGREDWAKMSSWGDIVISNHLNYHHSLKEAIIALHNASNLPPPSTNERMLQISIGGDPDSLMVGKFLPCQGLLGNPYVGVRCACGFKVDKANYTPQVYDLLRPTCNQGSLRHHHSHRKKQVR